VRKARALKRVQTLGLCFVFTVFLIGGLAHFVYLDLFTRVVPAYIPFPRTVVQITGICELVGAVALLFKPLRRLAGWAFALYLACVMPVHIDMLIHADRWLDQVSLTFLWVRPFLQPVLIVIVLWSTRPAAATA
jgi:uncharacterized membrane protein